MSTAGASSSAGVDQRVLRSSDVRTKRLLKRQMIATLASTLTAATSSSASKSRKTKPDSTRAEETEELAAKKSKAEAAVTITELSKDSEGQCRAVCLISSLVVLIFSCPCHHLSCRTPARREQLHRRRQRAAGYEDRAHRESTPRESISREAEGADAAPRSVGSASFRVAYHGTDEANLPSIVKANLRIEYLGRNCDDRGWYGAGCDLTPSSSALDLNTQPTAPSSNSTCCRVESTQLRSIRQGWELADDPGTIRTDRHAEMSGSSSTRISSCHDTSSHAIAFRPVQIAFRHTAVRILERPIAVNHSFRLHACSARELELEQQVATCMQSYCAEEDQNAFECLVSENVRTI
jgi:hypothetical protein